VVIEVDGSIHDQLKQEDAARESYLKQIGYKVLRIPDSIVRNTPALAVQMIADFIDEIK
jgi:very-short-patch-repair endonuclease